MTHFPNPFLYVGDWEVLRSTPTRNQRQFRYGHILEGQIMTVGSSVVDEKPNKKNAPNNDKNATICEQIVYNPHCRASLFQGRLGAAQAN
ncbi:hypothetical protein RJZ90_005842 [Blastomyces dermatitidis]